jgi:hypothetical protein
MANTSKIQLDQFYVLYHFGIQLCGLSFIAMMLISQAIPKLRMVAEQWKWIFLIVLIFIVMDAVIYNLVSSGKINMWRKE